MADSQEFFPTGRIALGNGDLVNVTNLKVSYSNNSAQVDTLRQENAGFTKGKKSCTVTFDAVVGEYGEEADWFAYIQAVAKQQIRIKIPGRTIPVNGVFTSIDLDVPLDAAITESLTFIGRLEP